MARFLFLSTMDGASPWGGSELLWSQTADRLLALGHEVHACVMQRPGKRAPALEQLQQRGLRLTYWRRLPRYYRLIRTPEKLISPVPEKLLAQIRPDLLVISNGYQVPPFAWTDAAQAVKVPYVHLAQALIESIWPARQNAERGAAAFEAARAVFWVSEGNRQAAFRQFAAQPEINEVVRNPYQVSRDTPFGWPEQAQPLKLASVGRLNCSHKGCDLILETLATPKWRARALEVTFFGEGDDGEHLRKLARIWQLENVHFAGYVDNVEGIWETHHALILPSRHEGLPLVVVEAMMRGRPCITTDVAGNAEVIRDGVDGFIAAGPSSRALDAALERCWQARDQLELIGQRAYESIRRQLPIDPAAEFAQRLTSLL